MSALQTITSKEISFDITEASIAKLKADAQSIVINGVDDKQGYKEAETARKFIKSKRVAVNKKREELNEEAIAYQRTVNAEAKRITSMLEPIEEELEAKIKAIDDEKERIKVEAIRAKQEKIASRFKQLLKLGMLLIGEMYHIGDQRVSHGEIETWDDEIWTDFVQICQREYDENQRILSEKKAEAERIEAEKLAEAKRIADEIEAERQRLEAIAQQQKAEAERLKKIADEQEAERQRLKVVKAGFDLAVGSNTSAVHVFDGMAKVEATVKKINAGSINGVKEILDIESHKDQIAPVFEAESITPIPGPESQNPEITVLKELVPTFLKAGIGIQGRLSTSIHPKNRKAMAQANAIGFLRDKGILHGQATEYLIRFSDNRPPVGLAELMAEFLCEFWSVPL